MRSEQSLAITLHEWEHLDPQADERLRGRTLDPAAPVQRLAAELAAAHVLEITELHSGLAIRAFSHVGTVRVGALQITVLPKLPQPSLLTLVRYAFGFRRLRLFAETVQQAGLMGLEDLLVSQLNAEAKELIGSGVHRTYVVRDELLPSPRGRLDIPRLARSGGVAQACLPCRHHPRIEDCLVNQVLLAGLHLAASVTGDRHLWRQSRRLAQLLEEQVSRIRLDAAALARVDRHMNRLTRAYEPAMTIIRLLAENRAVSLEDGDTPLALPGFLFDMNRFFQALCSRFLHDNLVGYTVRDESRLPDVVQYVPGFNPQHRRPPIVRPDFIVLRGDRVVAVLDAKYRDLWSTDLPPDMLYQLAMYAATQPLRAATILYPTLQRGARESQLAIRDPLRGLQVNLRPICLPDLEGLITAPPTAQTIRDRRQYAESLTLGRAANRGTLSIGPGCQESHHPQ